ncbi:hypothetical protein PMAYCL1PPCAC_30575, partial [Pristionchus mayeri]
YRHQSIVRGRFKLKEFTLRISRFLMILFCSSPGIMSFIIPFDASRTEELIDNYQYGNISWIRERSNYVLYVRNTANVVVLPVVALSAIFTGTLLLNAMLIHMIVSIY